MIAFVDIHVEFCGYGGRAARRRHDKEAESQTSLQTQKAGLYASMAGRDAYLRTDHSLGAAHWVAQ